MRTNNPCLTENKKIWHLLIGVNGAPAESEIPELEYCVKDCQDLAGVLKRVTPKEGDYQQFILHNGIPSVEQPTLKAFTDKLSTINKEAGKLDTLLVYITCHGVLLNQDYSRPRKGQLPPEGNKTYLCLSDTEVSIIENDWHQYKNTLALDELVQNLLKFQGTEIILILDTCHSGGMPFPDHFLNDPDKKFSAILSCKKNQSSYEEKSLRHSLFTHYLIQGLLGEAPANDRGEINLSNLFEFLCRQIEWHLAQISIKEDKEWKDHSYRNRGLNKRIGIVEQTPYIKVSFPGTFPVLGYKNAKQVNYPLRQALLLNQGLENFKTLLKERGLFEVQEWNEQDNLMGVIAEKLKEDPFNPYKKVLIYLKGTITEEVMQISDKVQIELSELRKIINQGELVQQILILDCLESSEETLKHWISQLGNPYRQLGRALIGLTSSQLPTDYLVQTICQILRESSEGLSIAQLMTKLQENTERFTTKRPEISLFGERDIIEIIPDPQARKPYQTFSFWRSLAKETIPQSLTTNRLTYIDGQKFNLNNMYVPLELLERKEQQRIENLTESAKGSRMYGSSTSIVQNFQGEEFFEKIFSSSEGGSSRLAIIGEPGSGKTTYLQKISNGTNLIPIWVSLADLRGKDLTDYLENDWLRNTFREEQITKEQKDALIKQFFEGNVFLLLDGIDEIVSQMNPLDEVSRNLTGWLKEARIILVTSRLNFWEVGSHGLSEFDAYRTLPFEDEQLKIFINNYFEQVNDPKSGQELLKNLAHSEKREIKDSVRNPLRLMLLCSSWRKCKKLPETKSQLYKYFVEGLYHFKKSAPTDKEKDLLHKALGELSQWALDDYSMGFRITLDNLPEHLKEQLGYKDEPGSSLWWALKLGWLNRVGVATEDPHQIIYAFFHPTFQEYFAATSIPEGEYFLDNNRFEDEKYQQVLQFWIGRKNLKPNIKQV